MLLEPGRAPYCAHIASPMAYAFTVIVPERVGSRRAGVSVMVTVVGCKSWG